jgi:hypothetical protein
MYSHVALLYSIGITSQACDELGTEILEAVADRVPMPASP